MLSDAISRLAEACAGSDRRVDDGELGDAEVGALHRLDFNARGHGERLTGHDDLGVNHLCRGGKGGHARHRAGKSHRPEGEVAAAEAQKGTAAVMDFGHNDISDLLRLGQEELRLIHARVAR